MSYLIIDPSPKRQQQLRAILISLGHHPTSIQTAGQWSEGVSSVKRKTFDCCFVFVNPTSSAVIAAVTGLRHGMVYRATPVVLYTQEANRSFVQDVSKSGASFLLAYPFSASGVESALRACGAAKNQVGG